MRADIQMTEYGKISALFSKASLAKVCVEKIGVQTGPFGSQLHNEDYVVNGTPIITVEHLGDNRITYQNMPCVSDEDKARLSKYCIQEGDIVFSRVGSVDRRALVRQEEDGWLFSGRCLRVRVDKAKIDPVYLSYFFGLEGFKNYIKSIAVGATMPSLNTKILSDVPIYFPELETQKKMGEILQDLDDKIAINRQINQTLESMAQTIFKSWFVDFEPVKAKIAALEAGKDAEGVTRAAMRAISGKTDDELNQMLIRQPENYAQLKTTAGLFPTAMQDSELGEVPEGWKVEPLGNYLTIKRGGSPRPIKDFIVPSGLPWVKIADATAEPSPFIFKTKESIKPEGLKKTVLLKKGSLILSNSATPGLPKFLELDACIHDGWLHFPKIELFSDVYLYQLFLEIRTKLVAQGNGSVFTNLKTDILRNQVVVAPTKEIINKFDDSFVLIFEKLKESCEEINLLSKLRDTLLPKLLSGEIRISMVEKMAVEKL